MIQVLQRGKKWFADGTFKVVPELDFQLYSIHCAVSGSVLPAAYILMTSKSAVSYERTFTAVKKVCSLSQGPSTVLADFEQAAISAFQVFPGTLGKGCLFHSGCTENLKKVASMNN